jgi:Fe-S-cluster containining protein
MSSFPCNGCGACCKSILLSPLTTWLDRGDGTCRYFDDAQNTCTIYENRPEICNVRLMYEKYYQNDFDWPEFILMNQKACDAILLRTA